MTVPSDTAAPTRHNWLDRVLGANKAQAVKQDVLEAQAALDGIGVQRKEQVVLEIAAPAEAPAASETPAPVEEGEAPPEAMAVAAAITEIIMGAAQADQTVLTSADRMAEVIAGAIQPKAAEEEAVPPTPPEGEEEKPEMKALVKAYTAQQDFIASATKDMGDMAQEVIALRAAVEGYKGLSEKMDRIIAELDAVKNAQAGKPRIASQAAETILDPSSEGAKAMAKSIKEGTEGESKFFSIPVKNTPK